MVLLLLGRNRQALTAFRELANAEPSSDPNDEYARCFAQMYLAYLEDDLIEADALAARLRKIGCREGVKALLFPMEPSLLAAESALSAMGIAEGDPLGFRQPGSGAYWLKATQAYAKGEFVQALNHMVRAEGIHRPSPAQKALKAGLLLHLGRAEEADQIFDAILTELGDAAGADERYLRLFCEVHRPASPVSDDGEWLAAARDLAPHTALKDFLPMPEFDAASVQAHFATLGNAYSLRSTALSTGKGVEQRRKGES